MLMNHTLNEKRELGQLQFSRNAILRNFVYENHMGRAQNNPDFPI